MVKSLLFLGKNPAFQNPCGVPEGPFYPFLPSGRESTREIDARDVQPAARGSGGKLPGMEKSPDMRDILMAIKK